MGAPQHVSCLVGGAKPSGQVNSPNLDRGVGRSVSLATEWSLGGSRHTLDPRRQSVSKGAFKGTCPLQKGRGGQGDPQSGYHRGSCTSREWHEQLRSLGPWLMAAARDGESRGWGGVGGGVRPLGWCHWLRGAGLSAIFTVSRVSAPCLRVLPCLYALCAFMTLGSGLGSGCPEPPLQRLCNYSVHPALPPPCLLASAAAWNSAYASPHGLAQQAL